MPNSRIFGHIEGVPVGAIFADRRELRAAGLHMPPQAGISGSQLEGADSIVVSGGYEDDEDYGSRIVYTGHGGLDPATHQVVTDQTLDAQNQALVVSSLEQLPVRVVRGSGGDPVYSPSVGYRYDGLYVVEHYWEARSASTGKRIFRFRLAAIDHTGLLDPLPVGAPTSAAGRRQLSTSVLIRNPRVMMRVKELHDHYCQVCGERIETPAGPYAEASHIRPLGRPHDGPDTLENILCLCPNDHRRFDLSAIFVDDDYTIRATMTDSRIGRLSIVRGHRPNPEFLRYHREHIVRM